MDIQFAVSGLDSDEQEQAYRLLRAMRGAAGDFPT